MGETNLFLRIFVRPEIFIYIAFLVFTAIFFILDLYVGNGGKSILRHYVDLNGPKMAWAAMLFFIALFLYGIVLCMRAMVKQINPAIVFTRQNLVRIFRGTRTILKNLATIGIPLALAFYSFSITLDKLNVFNRTRLRDELLSTWDTFLTGTFPSLSLASFQYPSWFISAVEFSFLYLVPVLAIFGSYLFIVHQRLFREAAGAFSLGLMILFAGWLMFPVLSPQDRFIDNVYELPVSLQVQGYVASYQPQEEIVAFLQGMRKSKENLSVFPTSTFPSAHAVWGVLLAYYSFRLSRWLLLGTLPLAILSSLGTFLFAQHYFVDVPAGILVAFTSILFVKWLAAKQRFYGTNKGYARPF